MCTCLNWPAYPSAAVHFIHCLKRCAGAPLACSPFTTNIPPVFGNSRFSSSSACKPVLVTNNQSKFGPPKQHEVVLLAGILTLSTISPVFVSQHVTAWPKVPVIQALPCVSTHIPSGRPRESSFAKSGWSAFLLVHCSQMNTLFLEWNQCSTWQCSPGSSQSHWICQYQMCA